MLMVIFGAGASYDSMPSRPPSIYPRSAIESRPPLAEELFLDSGFFAEALSRFSDCHPIVPYLQNVPQGKTLEHTLETLRSEAKTDPTRKRQLAAVQYYLHFMLWECERHWNDVAGGITNYVTLLDQLRRSCGAGDTVGLVTFNYDRMIESALLSIGVRMESLPQYISQDAFKLFKLHGSVHWGREVETPIDNVESRNVWTIVRELIQRADELRISTRFHIVQDHTIGKIGNMPLFPAIAIPVETKEEFECPRDHLECLRTLLPTVTKILIVGWRGTEYNFLNLLKESLTEEVPTLVVAENKAAASEVVERIQGVGVQVIASLSGSGFSGFVVNREAEEFLRR